MLVRSDTFKEQNDNAFQIGGEKSSETACRGGKETALRRHGKREEVCEMQDLECGGDEVRIKGNWLQSTFSFFV